MIRYDKNYSVDEEKIYIENIPCIRLTPHGLSGKLATVIFYHGLDSSKERQRMRAYILAFMGYQVIVPDALHHGERDRKETQDVEKITRYFWQAILKNIEESIFITREAIDKYEADKNRLYAMGHSMGGYTTAGVLAHNNMVKGGIILNGSLNWLKSNAIMLEAMGLPRNYTIPEEDDINILNPSDNMQNLKYKNILMIHGVNDPEVSIIPQREFYNENKDSLNIDMIEYDGLGHFVTTNMMEDVLNWLEAK